MVNIFKEIYIEEGNAEAHEIITLLTKYNTVASTCIYMLSDVLYMVAKLQGKLQVRRTLTFPVPGRSESTTKWLKNMKEDVSSRTWFKDHSLVFSDAKQLGGESIVVTEEKKVMFL